MSGYEFGTRKATIYGRTIGFCELGDPRGKPLIYLHGMTSSRISALSAHTTAKALGIRLIAFDRPGIGFSTRHLFSSVAESTADIVGLADFLKLKQFSILGHSGGGAYALATAWKMPQRVAHVGLVASAVPFITPEAKKLLPKYYQQLRGIARYVPWCISACVSILRYLFLYKTDKVLEANMNLLSDADKKIFQNPTLGSILIESAKEACRQGSGGITQDAHLLCSDWGFSLQKIKQKVTLWHGTADATIPYTAGKYLQKLLPDAKLILYPQQGHLFLFSQWKSILSAFI